MRTRKALLILAVVLAAGGGGRVHGKDTAGASSFDFLLWDSNAKAAALGGAYTALAWDANALSYNPAGLGKIRAQEATLMHSQFEGLTHDYLGLAAWQGWGLSLSYLNFGGLPRTTLSRPGGTGATVGLSDLALGAGYGRTWRESASFGAGVKYISERIDNRSADAYAFDAGWLYEAPLPGVSVGAALLNLSPDFKFQSVRGTLPLTLRGGAAYAFPAWGLGHTIALDLIKTRSDKPRIGFGIETVTAQAVAFRLGFTTRNDAGIGLTGGIGWLWRNLSVDYAVVPFGDLGIAHRASLTVRWGPGANDARRSNPDGAGSSPREAPARKETLNVPAPPGLKEHFVRANALINTKDFTGAKAELEAAAALLDPEDHRRALYHERIGFIALQENDLPKARASYDEGLRLAIFPVIRNRKLASLLNQGLGSILMAQNRFHYALRFFHKAHELNPSTETRRLIREAEERLEIEKNKQD